MSLLPVQDALNQILASVGAGTGIETIAIYNAFGRTLATDLHAQRTQPPADMSAMDGYAVHIADLETLPATLKLLGQSAAGNGFKGEIYPKTCVRIFTGAPVPQGADTVIIQENTIVNGADITVLTAPEKGKNIRKAGIDFNHGDVLLQSGTRLGATQLALAASMNHATLTVRKRPRIGILATGDELVEAGTELRPNQIISSNNFSIAALALDAGAEIFDLGIAPDNLQKLIETIQKAQQLNLDVIVTLGGASVGDHDLVQEALKIPGCTPDFWRIAMRPGKPMMFGSLGKMRVLGLPGNPVASHLCGLIFLQPLLRALVGDPNAGQDKSQPARLGCDIAANDKRQDYIRCSAVFSSTALPVITPFVIQDSSMLSTLAKADALLIREPFADVGKAGDLCRIIKLNSA